ncbi:hypothetical protein ACI797_25570 [Geodermatophilus sp. SYSU D00691]
MEQLDRPAPPAGASAVPVVPPPPSLPRPVPLPDGAPAPVDGGRLAGVVLAPGAGQAFSGEDLTSPATALGRGEVPALADGDPVDVLQLRIHGVGGAPAPDNLESPATLQVAGDGRAGFFRAWFPGGTARGRPRVEAYCWGRLNYQASWSALWLLLLPFGLVNVAHWALPERGAAVLRQGARAVLRLLALTLTASFVATTAYLLVDLVAWQAASVGTLWSWLGWFADLGAGVRMALAGAVVLLVVAVLWWLSTRTQGAYERRAPGPGMEELPGLALSRPTFWCGERPLVRQRRAHLTVASSVVAAVLLLPESSAPAVRWVLLTLCAALAAVAVVALLTPWADRIERAGDPRDVGDAVTAGVAWAALGLAGGTALARLWWRPHPNGAALPGDRALQVVVLDVSLGLVVVLLLVVCLQRPWAGTDVMGRGLTSVAVALTATLVAGIFSAALLMTAANLLARPTYTQTASGGGGEPARLALPATVFACGLAFAVALVSTLLAGLALAVVRWRTARALATGTAPSSVGAVYADRGAAAPGTRRARRAVAGLWATSMLTDRAAPVLFGVAVPTALVLVGYQFLPWSAWNLLAGLASLGTGAAVFVAGLFLLFLRSALTSSGSRKRVGFFWDVVTFWPRACHPFGPPSYAERSVPEVVTRVRRVVGDTAHGPTDPALAQQLAEAVGGVPREPHSPVVVVGYSQGTVIAAAVVAQLPRGVRRHVALLTLAAPVRRLYGRAFPAYFGAEQIERLEGALTDDGVVRWHNLVRLSDYIGGWVRRDPYDPDGARPGIDSAIVDPPVLWTDDNPSPPPAHLHSDWFQDPQTWPYLRGLVDAVAPRAAAHR